MSFVIVKKSRHYVGGPGRDGKVYATAEEALAVAIELTQQNPVGFDVRPFEALKCEVCGGAHVEEVHTPRNV